MGEAGEAGRWERTEEHVGYRSGYRNRRLVTRADMLGLRVPRERAGRFSTELLEGYRRSPYAFVGGSAEMYIQGMSTR